MKLRLAQCATKAIAGLLREAVYLRDDSGSKLHLDLKSGSEKKRDLFANQNTAISSSEGLPKKLDRKSVV